MSNLISSVVNGLALQTTVTTLKSNIFGDRKYFCLKLTLFKKKRIRFNDWRMLYRWNKRKIYESFVKVTYFTKGYIKTVILCRTEVIFVDLLTPKPVGIYQRISTTSIICHGFIVMKVAPDFVAFTNCLAPVSSWPCANIFHRNFKMKGSIINKYI